MAFLLKEGIWVGSGQVNLCEYDKIFTYSTTWKIFSELHGKIVAVQEVILEEGQEIITNIYNFMKLEEHAFLVELENEAFGKVSGKGIISDQSIAWEFHGDNLAFEGFEVFQVKDDGTYISRAEYASEGEPHSIISGTLWKK